MFVYLRYLQDVKQDQFLNGVKLVRIHGFPSLRLFAKPRLKSPPASLFSHNWRKNKGINSQVQDLNLGCSFHFLRW